MITRQLTVYTARSRKDAVLQETSMDVGGLFARLSTSQELAVTHGEYMGLKKSQQDELKDVGAYIPGQLRDGRRRKGCIITRSAAVLDADNLPSGSVERFAASVAALGCCYCIHSTAKHSPGSPRLRVVIPFSTDIPAEQYPAVVRLLCQLIQPEMSWFDPATVEAGRIMFWSAHCKDVEPVFFAEDRPFLDPVQLLERLPDWKDPSTWPRFPREAESLDRLLQRKRQQDPEGKTGIAVLNFASAKNPGGGFLNGAMAQEESLAASGGLYPTLTRHPAYYDRNRACRSMVYTGCAIYSPEVVFFRDGAFRLLEHPVTASVLTLPAVNLGQVMQRGEDLPAARAAMGERMERALRLFGAMEDRVLVLGAYGCGVFRNDPEDVARRWQELLNTPDYAGRFRQVVFAVLDRSRSQSCQRAFAARFGG